MQPGVPGEEPLADEQLSAYLAQFRGVMRDDFGVAAARNALVSMLVSPYFALRIEFGPGNNNDSVSMPELGARISHFAARTTPDDTLRASIETYAEIRRRRYRSLAYFWRFGRGWLRRVDATLARSLKSTPPSQPSQETKPMPDPQANFPNGFPTGASDNVTSIQRFRRLA